MSGTALRIRQKPRLRVSRAYAPYIVPEAVPPLVRPFAVVRGARGNNNIAHLFDYLTGSLQQKITARTAASDEATDVTAGLAAMVSELKSATMGRQGIIPPGAIPLNSTIDLDDATGVFLDCSGVYATQFDWYGGLNYMFTPRSTQTAARKMTDFQISRARFNCNSLAKGAIHLTSVNDFVLNRLRIYDSVENGLLTDCLDDDIGDDDPNNQIFDISQIYVKTTTGKCIYLNNNQGALSASGGDTSLGKLSNIRVSIENNDGLVWGGCDGNSLDMFSSFIPASGGPWTGRGMVFEADDTGNNNHARCNFCFNVQSARAGVYALAGDGTQPSADNFIVFNLGNGAITHLPTIEAGATLGYISSRVLKNFGGQLLSSSGSTDTNLHANVKAQLALMGTEAHRFFSGSNNHSRWVDSDGNEWAVNIDAATGNFRLQRITGSGTVLLKNLSLENGSGDHLHLLDFDGNEWVCGIDGSTGDFRLTHLSGTGIINLASAVMKTVNVATGISTKTVNATLVLASNGVQLIDCSAGNVTITLPLANIFGAGKAARFLLRRIDATGNTCTIQKQSTDTVDGGASFTLVAGAGRTLVSDGVSAWYSF